MKKIEKKNSIFFLFLIFFFHYYKGPESGNEKKRKSGIRTFENLPDFRTGLDVRLSPISASAEKKDTIRKNLKNLKIFGKKYLKKLKFLEKFVKRPY